MNKVNISQIILIYFSRTHEEPTRNQSKHTRNPPNISHNWLILVDSQRVPGGFWLVSGGFLADSWWVLIGSWSVLIGSGHFTFYDSKVIRLLKKNLNQYMTEDAGVRLSSIFGLEDYRVLKTYRSKMSVIYICNDKNNVPSLWFIGTSMCNRTSCPSAWVATKPLWW